MASRSRLNIWLLTLLCGALLVARVSGAHLHLCFDGSEPFASVHMLDAEAAPAGSGLSATHHDDDVSLTGEFVSKSGKTALDLPILPTAEFLARIQDRTPGLATPTYLSASAASNGRLLLPPPRAPPAC